MKLHWKILLWMLAGAIVGGVFQGVLDAPSWVGLKVEDGDAGVRLTGFESGSPAVVSKPGSGPLLQTGDLLTHVIFDRGDDDAERIVPTPDVKSFESALAEANIGTMMWIRRDVEPSADTPPLPIPVQVVMEPGCERDLWLTPFRLVASVFLKLLKMLIVPIILTSIITGVAGVGSGKTFGRLGLKTFGYYICTSFLAIFSGLILVNLIRPGVGAKLGLSPTSTLGKLGEENLWDIFVRMVPENIFGSASDNSQMLQIIFFALLFGYFITRTAEPHQGTMKAWFEAAFEVMMKMAVFVLGLIPYGVFALLVKVVGETGFGMFRSLAVYMVTVVAALFVHAVIVLPLLLRIFGGVSPRAWFKAAVPALMTAFSTSSSSMTLPVTLETVEKRGKVSGRVGSFTLPLGATINMDGTALYECVGVIFLAQFYAGVSDDFTLTISNQIFVVVMALMASIGAAGVPSAGLVMMLTILSGLGLPTEGAALLLAVDRPLDMLRTTVNVWSDTCAAAIIARSEGETEVGTPFDDEDATAAAAPF